MAECRNCAALKAALAEALEAIGEYCAADVEVEPWLQAVVARGRAALDAAPHSEGNDG
jgi:hypothetical protein